MGDPQASFKPYVPDDVKMREFTWSALILGTSLGLIFAASSLYLVLKIGMTVSASIPVAVLAITVFRALSKAFGLRQATILENNIVQTAGSAGESIAFGVGVALPTLLLLGFSMDITRIMVVSLMGGFLGILAMIPLRRAFIVKMHGRPGQPGTLLYPEGTACAQVLISGETGGTTGKTVFIGFGIAFAHKIITSGMALLKETVTVPLTFINRAAVFAQEMAPELLGVGYIIGLRTSAVMMAGAVLGYLVIIPIIYLVGEYTDRLVPPGEQLIRDMTISGIRNNYLLFIGAGTVATAGIVSMLKTLPVIVRSLTGGLRSAAGGSTDGERRRTEHDMPMSVVLLGSLGLLALLAVFLWGEVGPMAAIAGALLVLLFGFLFVTVSARLTGEIGSSSNPISGMTTATLMLTCLIFLALGWQSSTYRLLALSVAAVVCIASSNGGTTAQSLKTGFLVGGTPKLMQYAILIGALISGVAIGGTLIAFNESRAVISNKPENVPNHTLTKPELDRLHETVTHDGRTYKVWHTGNDVLQVEDKATGFKPRSETQDLSGGESRMFYVNPETGKLEYLKDNTIMGRLDEKDDGSYVKREFEAPKTRVMGIVINGVLKGDLNWSMIAIGAMIALMLELCGVSALAFAVGLYVPIQYSAPIFVGGIIRYLVDRYLARQAAAEAAANMERALAAAGDDPAARIRAEAEAKAQAEIDAIRKSETSGGVLLASGFIAGGSLAAVLLGFLAFHDDWPDDLRQWERRSVAVSEAQSPERAAESLARAELGVPLTPVDSSRFAEIQKLAAEIAEQSKKNPRVKELTEEIRNLDKNDPRVKSLTTALSAMTARDERIQSEAAKLASMPPNDPTVLKVANEIVDLADGDARLKKPAAKLAEYTLAESNVKALAREILGLNRGEPVKWVMVPSGAKLKLPEGKGDYDAKNEVRLKDVAAEVFGRERKAGKIFDKNDDELSASDKEKGYVQLKPQETLPKEAELSLPTRDWPAWLAFGGLALLLLVVGIGKLLGPRPENANGTNGTA